ncbi:hypothetical protein Dimus_000398 [Dionaea muscipula]
MGGGVGGVGEAEKILRYLRTLVSKNMQLVRIKHQKHVGILAFEVAGIISKLLLLHQSLSDKSILHLKDEAIALQGVRKIVSNDDSFLLSLAVAEHLHTLRLAAASAARISRRCDDPALRSLGQLFDDFTERGRDPHNWVLSGREFEALARKAERHVAATSVLYREMEELLALENGGKKPQGCKGGDHKKVDVEQKIAWQRNEVRSMKEKSLWNRSFDSVALILAKLIFSILARIKLVFGIGHGYIAAALPRSLSASATVFPAADQSQSQSQSPSLPAATDAAVCVSVSGPLKFGKIRGPKIDLAPGFFESNTKVLKAPSSTIGAAGLALHYANLIIVVEKMVRSPHLIGPDARDDLYMMLPRSVRASLRARLRGVGFSARDPVLAGEWREAMGRILGWLSPLAHNMIKWQSERSFEQHKYLVLPKTNVLLLQTLFFANKDKTEAAITELLVGLNYIWRFEREIMNAKSFLNSKFRRWPDVDVQHKEASSLSYI